MISFYLHTHTSNSLVIDLMTLNLLQVVRELSTEQEKREQEGIDEKTRELQNKLDETNDELERLRDDRVRQATMVENIVRQRDMYRVLLSQGSNVSCILIFCIF